jgi:hypothetical protein
MIDLLRGKLRNIGANLLMDDAPPTAEQYRNTAEGIREMAQRSTSEEIRKELLELVERYERLALRAHRRSKFACG